MPDCGADRVFQNDYGWAALHFAARDGCGLSLCLKVANITASYWYTFLPTGVYCMTNTIVCLNFIVKWQKKTNEYILFALTLMYRYAVLVHVKATSFFLLFIPRASRSLSYK